LVREIKYDGYIFRSKIEAQWYVFFNKLGFECHYEPETISLELSNGRIINYLIDFFLPDFNSYVEIKLEKTPQIDACQKCYLLAQQTGKDVFLFYQIIGSAKFNGYKYYGSTGAFMPLQRFVQCPKCSNFDITYLGMVSEMSCGCCKQMGDLTNSESYTINEAVKKVRSERIGS